MWHHNKNVDSTYSSSNSSNAWANIAGLGWRKILPTSPDGTTNVLTVLAAARANNRQVGVAIDAGNNITTAYIK